MRILSFVAITSLVACSDSSSSPDLVQQPASSTAFMGVVVHGGRTKLYMASPDSGVSGETQVAVVDAGAPSGASGVLSFVNLGTGVRPRAVGADGTDVVVLDRDAPVVHFIDGATDTLLGSASLPAGAELILSSNGGSYSSAVSVDATRRKAYVATSLGVAQYDLDLRGHSDTFTTPPTESFALDRTADRIYAPFYLCEPNPADPTGCYPYSQPGGPALTDSFTVIDVAARGAFAFVDPAAADTHAPLGFGPDATAIDVPLGLLAVATEEPSVLWVMDLATATYDTPTTTCQMGGLPIAMPGAGYTMVAADPGTHLLVVAEEYATGIVFVDLSEAKQGRTRKLEVTMPDLPTGDPWLSKGDPHSVAIGVVGGRAFAFVAEGSQAWIARIDLAGVRDVMSGAGTFASKVSFISVAAPP